MAQKYLVLALKNVRRRGLRSWLTMLGIFIGIAAVVSLVALGGGLREAILGQFSSLGTDKLIITNAETGFGPPGSMSISKLTDHDVSVIKQVNGLERIIPRLLRPVSIEYNKVTGYGYAVSMPKDDRDSKFMYESFKMETASGKLLYSGDKGKVVLGSDYAKQQIYGKDLVTGSKIKLQGQDFEVMGVLKPLSSFQMNLAILMNQEYMENMLKITNEYDMIVVQIAPGEDIESVAESIKEKLRRDRNEKEGNEDFSVQTPVSALNSVNTILVVVNLIVAAIAGISLLVGGLGIANTMYTSVLERTREIGVMKAIGARNSDILLIFLFEAGLLGLVGGVIGAAMGVALSFGVAAIANVAMGSELFKVTFSLPLVLGAFSFSFLIGIISGVFPALQASKLNPVDALRK